MVAPGGIHRGYIDALSTKKHSDQIFIVPGHPYDPKDLSYSTVVIGENGGVNLSFYYNGTYTTFLGSWVVRSSEKYGWVTKNDMIGLRNWNYFSKFYNETYNYFSNH